MGNRRQDTYTSLLVNIALGLPKREQARYLAVQGVPLRVAKRVLLKPDARRN